MTIILNRPGFLRLPEVPGVSVTWLGPSVVMVVKRLQIGFIVVPLCSNWNVFFFRLGQKPAEEKFGFGFGINDVTLISHLVILLKKTNWTNWFWAIPTLANWNLIRWTWSAKAVCIFSSRSRWGLRVNFFWEIGMWQKGPAGDSYLLQVMARGTCDSGIAAQMQ